MIVWVTFENIEDEGCSPPIRGFFSEEEAAAWCSFQPNYMWFDYKDVEVLGGA